MNVEHAQWRLEQIQRAADGVMAIADVIKEVTTSKGCDLGELGNSLVDRLMGPRIMGGLASALDVIAGDISENAFELIDYACSEPSNGPRPVPEQKEAA